MSANSKIEWCDDTWNPVVGCSKVSPGCKHCYAINHVHRMAGNPNPKIATANAGLTVLEGGHPNWTGKVRLIPERLQIPLLRKRPTRYFVNSLSDLFHEDLSYEDSMAVLRRAGVSQWHQFQILTKRSERMRAILYGRRWRNLGKCERADSYYVPVILDEQRLSDVSYLPNVWLGVSVESRDYLHRIDDLRRTPAAVRFLSLEPLLEDLGDISEYLMDRCPECGQYWKRGWRDCPNPQACDGHPTGGIDWVIVGGESGPDARMMQALWAQSIRDQCVAAGVPFFMKQWGEYLPDQQNPEMTESGRLISPPWAGIRVGKKKAGRLLDGRTWDEMPKR